MISDEEIEALELICRAFVHGPDGLEEFFARASAESVKEFVDRVVAIADEWRGTCFFGSLQ